MTVKFTKIIYILILVLVAMSLIFGWLVPAFSIMATDAALLGVLRLLFGWIIPVIQLVLFRVMLEQFIATIRTAQNTAGTRQEIQVLRQELA